MSQKCKETDFAKLKQKFDPKIAFKCDLEHRKPNYTVSRTVHFPFRRIKEFETTGKIVYA